MAFNGYSLDSISSQVYKHLQRSHNLLANQLQGPERERWEWAAKCHNAAVDQRIYDCFPNYVEGRWRVEKGPSAPSSSSTQPSNNHLYAVAGPSRAYSQETAIEQLVRDASSSSSLTLPGAGHNRDTSNDFNDVASSPSINEGQLGWALDAMVSGLSPAAVGHEEGSSGHEARGSGVKIEETTGDFEENLFRQGNNRPQ